jgi:cytochrome P450
MRPPKPASRPRRVSLWRYLRAFRRDILSAQPEHLYAAKMAEFRTPFFRSFLLNEPDLVDEVLRARPDDFPKSARVTEGLRPLLGDAVFVTNGEAWRRQRRIIDPAFETARLSAVLPTMREAAEAAVARLEPGEVDIEPWASHTTADVIFRTLFSIPIEDRMACAVYDAFRDYQRTQPILNLAAFLPLPRWMPRFHRRRARRAAREIRSLLSALVAARRKEIGEGRAPDDLATRIMTATDPETGEGFSEAEMVDQVAIFFLAGHETSAAALAWALYLLATHPEAQERVAEESRRFVDDPEARLSTLAFTRDVFRETLRLYPPVPMMVRETRRHERFRDRDVPQGAQVVISPWHLHRNPRYWFDPDVFDPERWSGGEGRAAAKEAFLPFSAGPRVCPGAGFAMAEGTLVLALSVLSNRFAPVLRAVPVPVAHLTVRSQTGIFLNLSPRIPSPQAT